MNDSAASGRAIKPTGGNEAHRWDQNNCDVVAGMLREMFFNGWDFFVQKKIPT